MILNCPKCKRQFALSHHCFQSGGRIDLTDFMICTQCNLTLAPLEFVTDTRWGEFLEWVNAWNKSLIRLRQIEKENRQKLKPKSLWDVLVSDSTLREVLISKEKLPKTSSTPTLRFIARSSDRPSSDFILDKFNEHLNKVYQFGSIDPFIQCSWMCVAADGNFFDI